MAKEAKKAANGGKPTEAKAAAKPAEKKPHVIKKVEPKTIGSGSMELTPFKANQVAVFGNKFMIALVAQAGLEAEAQKALKDSAEAKTFLGFEMIKAIFSIAVKTRGTKNEVDPSAIFGEPKDVERLNNRILIEMGVMKKDINEKTDAVEYIWTDAKVEQLYSYSKALKEKDEPEYTKRFNNRKRLNFRLSEACKAAASLMDYKLSPDDLFYSTDEAGNMVPTIKNAPKQIGGDAGVVQMNVRKPVKGADLSPTIASLIKISTDRHKPKGDRLDKTEKREDEKMGMTDEDFGGIVNSLRRAIIKQEGVFSPEMQKQCVAFKTFLDETISQFIIKKPVAETQADNAAAGAAAVQ